MPEYPLTKKVVTLTVSSLADGASNQNTWRPKENWIIERIIVWNDAGDTFTNSLVTLKIGETVITESNIPAGALGTTYNRAIPWDLPIRQGEEFTFSVTNGEGATRTFYCTLVLRKP